MITVLVDEPLIQATTYIPLMDNSDSGTLEKREPVEVVKHNVNEGIQKSSGKKLKNETDKGKKLMVQFVSGIACLQTSTGKTCGEGDPLWCDVKKGFEKNICGCRMLFLCVLVSALSLALWKGLCAI